MTISPLVFGLTAQLSKQRAQLSFGQGHSRCLEITSCIIFLIHTEISMHSSDPSGPRIIIIHIIHSMGISTTSGLSHRLDGICLVHIWARTILPKKKKVIGALVREKLRFLYNTAHPYSKTLYFMQCNPRRRVRQGFMRVLSVHDEGLFLR